LWKKYLLLLLLLKRKIYCTYLVRLFRYTVFLYFRFMYFVIFISSVNTYTQQIDFQTLTSCVWCFHFILLLLRKRKLRKY